jgi:hypothetical protein
MHTTAGQPATLQPAQALPFWPALKAFFRNFAKRIQRTFGTVTSGTTLVRDPFSAEQNRD